jgi:hypothetical protein
MEVIGLKAGISDHLKLETGEVLGDGRLERSTITADLTFCLTSTEPAESAMRYWPFIGDDHGGIGPFITFDIIASRSRFRELVTNVRHGLVPENISIKLAEDEKFWRSVDPTSKWSSAHSGEGDHAVRRMATT